MSKNLSHEAMQYFIFDVLPMILLLIGPTTFIGGILFYLALKRPFNIKYIRYIYLGLLLSLIGWLLWIKG
jgi:hypothetical protein